MNIRLNTSFRSRGKWGDYLVTLIPLSWCLNILLNSNFILRMIEWQSESGSLIIRIHGKQWYWIYKYDLANVMSLINTPKNIGNNRWASISLDGISANNKYIQETSLKIRTSSQQEYWGEVAAKDINPVSSFKLSHTLNLNNQQSNQVQSLLSVDNKTDIFDEGIYNFNITNTDFSSFKKLLQTTSMFRLTVKESADYNNIQLQTWDGVLKNVSYNLCGVAATPNTQASLYFYDNVALDDAWEVYSNTQVSEVVNPVRFFAHYTNQQYFDTVSTQDLVGLKFFDSNNAVVEKPEENIDFVVIKQKRYKRKQNINNYWVKKSDSNVEWQPVKKITGEQSTARFLHNNSIIQQITGTGATNSFDFYSSVKLNRTRSESFSINLSRRLLRTTRTLVLPAYTNISIIANSYDVVHSWFIPGLGLKIDCVPGKSTHHSLYIDNVGLYYGQCAEICGRYHHHMPIRVCALPFEHFLIWWTNKGLPKSTRTRYNPKRVENVLLLKYRW